MATGAAIRHLTRLYGFMVAGQDLQNYASAGCLQLLLQNAGVLAHLPTVHLPTPRIIHHMGKISTALQSQPQITE